MAKHSFAYGVFIVGRYRSGPLKHGVYVKDAGTGRFVGGELRRKVLIDVFKPKRIGMWRMTMGINWYSMRIYWSTKIQIWGRSKNKIRELVAKLRYRWATLNQAYEDYCKEFPGTHGAKYVKRDKKKREIKWMPGVSGWFEWELHVGWDRVVEHVDFVGWVEGPRSEKS